FQAEDGIRDKLVTGVQTCALPIFQGVVIGPGRLRRVVLLLVLLLVVLRRLAGGRAAQQGTRGRGEQARGGQGSHGRTPGGEAARSEERRVGKEWRFGCGLGMLIVV